MSTVGQKERATQHRALFLGYEYLGNWQLYKNGLSIRHDIDRFEPV